MCGICGYIDLSDSRRAREDVLRGMMSALVHRGPDDEGVYLKENVALGHRRLSIIDLKTGRQPIFNEDGSIAIVYNGEIYNFRELKEDLLKKGHVFRTHSDTEVVVHAYEEYGEDCLKKFCGMFAFAIWDSGKKTVFLARDRFGKKPLYYAVFDRQFIFASELKAVLKHPAVSRRIDSGALSKYLAYEYVPSPYSIFKDIYKLKAGSRLSVPVPGIGSAPDGKSLSEKAESYWDINFKRGREKDFDLKSAARKLTGLLEKAVEKRLVSDVPLGVFLSGGIDSSSVVAMMARLMKPKEIKTFSIGFRERPFDESDDARRIAGHFGTDHHEEMLEPRAMLEVFPAVLDMLDEPFADSSIIPTYLVSAFARRHVKVALGGDGGDELFMGYPSFLAHRLGGYSSLLNPVKNISRAMLNAAAGASYNYTSLSARAGRFFRGLDFPEDVRQQVWIGSFTPDEEKELFSSAAGRDCDVAGIYGLTRDLYNKMKDADPLDRASYIYMKTYMTDDILAKVDRASMANSLEVRAPFLDTEFAEFAAAIPGSYKLKGLKGKWILRQALRGILPDETLNKPKRGFAVPVAKWLKEDLKDLFFAAFDKKKIEKEGIFDYNYIAGLMQEFLGNKRDARKEIWALFMFEMWYDRWM